MEQIKEKFLVLIKEDRKFQIAAGLFALFVALSAFQAFENFTAPSVSITGSSGSGSSGQLAPPQSLAVQPAPSYSPPPLNTPNSNSAGPPIPPLPGTGGTASTVTPKPKEPFVKSIKPSEDLEEATVLEEKEKDTFGSISTSRKK